MTLDKIRNSPTNSVENIYFPSIPNFHSLNTKKEIE